MQHHDQSGQQLHAGDRVLIEFTVMETYAGPNADVRLAPVGGGSLYTCPARITRKVQSGEDAERQHERELRAAGA